ncbi:hypothetical protein [Segeticoccus rhizosphaerae]|uniref:hypothetical protein n=1 Tax=Segeticoccus rhizosphaerae TaxID=1104777 RepID=UPI00192E471C|nr:hypothetical protein [Ornithinicoccus soli]
MHRSDSASTFFGDYFGHRKVLLLGGAGFDPRACITAEELERSGAELQLQLIRENRAGATEALLAAAEANFLRFQSLTADLHTIDVDIFDKDGAIVGGRRAAAAISELGVDGYSDVVVDISALSIGTSFPLVRLLVEKFSQGARPTNLHITVAHAPEIDAGIGRTAGDRPGWIHGFSGTHEVDRDQIPAKLWMPQLSFGRRQEIRRIYEFVDPDDTCPILPFPARDPLLADKIAIEYREELLSTWQVDVRNIVYADEDDPLDVYRTILRIDDLRQPVFAGSGGSATIVSPTGSKLTALGTLMACIERDLPVAYLEAESYEVDTAAPSWSMSATTNAKPNLVHLWLEGDAYPEDRPTLRREV